MANSKITQKAKSDQMPVLNHAPASNSPSKSKRILRSIGLPLLTLGYLIKHTFSLLKNEEKENAEFYTQQGKHPDGTGIEPDLIPIIQLHMYSEETERHNGLEQKAANLLNTTLTVIPLIGAGSLYILRASVEHYNSKTIAISILIAGSFIFEVLSLVAAFRGITVKTTHKLWIDSVYDGKQQQYRRFSSDFYGRGLIWCGFMNAGLNNKLADFVRAAQYFLVISAMCALIAAAFATPTILSNSKEVGNKATLVSSNATSVDSIKHQVITAVPRADSIDKPLLISLKEKPISKADHGTPDSIHRNARNSLPTKENR